MAEPTAKAPVTTEYRAPTVGLEDKVFTIGSTLDAAKFKTVKEELDKYFATQSWSDRADAAMAFEALTEPHYNEPVEPEPPKRVMGEDAIDYEVKIFTYKMAATKYVKANDKKAHCVIEEHVLKCTRVLEKYKLTYFYLTGYQAYHLLLLLAHLIFLFVGWCTRHFYNSTLPMPKYCSRTHQASR